jgi:spore germination protein YaaH
MPNLDPWIKEYENKYSIAEERSKFEYYLLSISDERQKIILPNCQITYNERQEKIIKVIDWTIETYTSGNQKEEEGNILLEKKESEQIWIDNILEELDKKCLLFDTNYEIERHFEDRNPITCNMCGFTY